MAAPLAMFCGLFTAFGCGLVLSAPNNAYEAKQNGAQIAHGPVEIVPTSYQDVREGNAQPEQMAQIGMAQGRLGPPPEIVVKLKDAQEADRICDIFWKDKNAGRAAFKSMFADKPDLAKVQLKRVTYSNEFVLDLYSDDEKTSTDMGSEYSKVIKSLKALPSIAYAEPNATAQPGKNG
ncbi:hypothetical protein ACFQS8_11555 [Hirschia litorea]|uniref:Lipoprotein n=2 Tax=Hirschia litorea TaxID=1199156 RepID=A0ABW2IN05_9PROT